MDEVRAFLNNPSPSKSQVIKLRGPLTGGVSISKHDALAELNRKAEHRHSVTASGTDYAKEIRSRETKLYLRRQQERKEFDSMCEGFESLEQLPSFASSNMNIAELNDEAMKEVYSKYSLQKKETTKKLPINEYMQQILNSIQGSEVLVIEGPTGCGKTTQVPQWILDNCVQNQKACNIVVTQPRRIAAISIAKRVAHERGWDVGGLVGYQVGLENRTSSDTRISYVTTGVLLQKLVGSKTMNEYTHIILDEVHERGQEMDFLLLVVKKLLFTVSPNVKIVLMSATIQASIFTEYFMIPTPQGLQSSQCIKAVKTNEMFNVKTFYLNDLKQFGAILQQCTPKTGEPCIMPEMHHLVVKLLNAFEIIDPNEDDYTDRSEADLPSVLIFLPGIFEIEELYLCLTNEKLREKLAGAECARYNWWVLPLHSTITADEQVRVFQRAQPGYRKIILATNIAESSITVPDIKYVIDYCLMKTLVADDQTNFTTLQLTWAAKSNCDQRAGRAGRVRDGRIYRLVNKKFYDSLPKEGTPEIKRCPLERLVLLAKMLDMGPPSDILALALDPPDLSNIHRTLLVLKEIGAMKKMTLDGMWVPNDGEVTYLGRLMAKLPLDVKLAKLIMLGYIYGCLEESIIMAAGMSAKNIFSSPFRERLNAFNSKLTWADGSTSDCIAFMNVYRVWSHLRQQNYFKQQGNSEVQWASRFYVQIRSLRETDEMVRELKQRLSREGIEPAKGNSPWAKNEVPLVLKVILAGAFYPQYFIQVSLDEDRERDAVKVLGGLDPRNTVYLKNFPDDQPGEVYAAAIKNVIRQQISDEPRVIFDSNSKKVFLSFNDGISGIRHRERDSGDPTIPGEVVLPVYKAVKARQLKIDVRIPLLPPKKAEALAQEMKQREVDLDLEKMVPRLPDIDETHFPLKICLLNNMSDFWVQHDDESTSGDMRKIQNALNKAPLLAHTGPIECGDIYAAPLTDVYYRAKVLKLLRNMVQVLFIDIGVLSSRVSSTKLRVLPARLCQLTPPLAMRCRLAALAPPPLHDAHGTWTQHAIGRFRELCFRGPLLGKVYSVVQGVVSIELLAEGGKININHILLRDGCAVPCEESYESKLNHDLRQTANELNLTQKRAHNKEQTKLAYNQLREIQPPSPKECNSDVCLKGPFSRLKAWRSEEMKKPVNEEIVIDNSITLPLESTLHTLMYASREKQVVIEWNSVNSVLLDTAPQETHERLIVAGNVGQNEHNSKLTLRHTTRMPNIPGLPALIALIFCPNAELRRDTGGTRYVSLLCGLGSAEDGAPYFPEHDLLLNIDADMSIDDISSINHIRHLMDYMMYCQAGQEIPTAGDEMRPRIPKLIRQDLIKLLMKRRKHREPQSVDNPWEWRSVPEDELLEIDMQEFMMCADVYPLHSPQELQPVAREHLMALKRDNDNLKLLVSRTPISSPVELSCKLCGIGPMPNHAMRIHLYSNAHMEKEEDFHMFQS